jgi:hypothetical protein
VPSVKVRGAEKLARVADVLAEHADGRSLRNKMLRNIRLAAAPITAAQRASVAAGLPQRGGLAATVTGAGKFSVRSSLKGKRVGVTIVDSWPKHDMRAIDHGYIRHPLFGNRAHWYTTRAKPGLLTRPFWRHESAIRRAVIRAIDETAREIVKEIK